MPGDNIPEYIQNLAGDLYMLIEKDMYFTFEGETKEECIIRLNDAIKANRWEEVLVLLINSLDLDRALIAEYRGRAWKYIGNERAAEKFLSYANKLREGLL